VVALPNDASAIGDTNRVEYDYDLEYLESQMRGADWERYLTRLDEEISIGLFTPILLLRTADVGSYNLGVGHMQMYLWMLNAMNADRKQYIDKYILSRIADFNFSTKAPRPTIKFRKLGNQNAEVIRTIIEARMAQGTLGVDVVELGEIAGLSLKDIKSTLQDPGEDDQPASDDDEEKKTDDSGSTTEPRATAEKITARISQQVANLYKTGTLSNPDVQLTPGYRKKLEQALLLSRVADPVSAADTILGYTMEWANEARLFADDPGKFMHDFEQVLNAEIAEYVK